MYNLDSIYNYLRNNTESTRCKVISSIPKHKKLIQIYVRYGNKLNAARYTSADPFKIIWVDPNKIKNSSKNGWPLRLGRVKNGDWDQNTRGFFQRTIPKSIKLYFVENKSWKNTPLHKNFIKKINKDGSAWGYNSPKEFYQRCSDIEELYQNIKHEGYYLQEELDGSKKGNKNGSDPHPILDEEIRIDIGRDGELLWRNAGQHRLSIAKILNIKKVPVYVVCRHTQWEKFRQKRGVKKQMKEEHPDLLSC